MNRIFRSPLLCILLSASLFLHACATAPREEETTATFENSGNLETLVILGTNDIHGALAPEKLKTRDEPPVEYQRGGASIFAAQVRILRKQYGEHLILLDGGDQFQGSIDSNLEEGRPMVQFFNELGYTAAALGNHDFDFGPEGSHGIYNKKDAKESDVRGTLKARMQEANYPYLAANVFDMKTKRFPGVPGTKPSVLVKVGRLKVGIVGMTSLDTPTSTRAEFARGLEFHDMESVALEETKKLREAGADIVVLVAHSGVFCNIPLAADRGARTGIVKSDADFQTGCEGDQEIPSLLRKLPKGTFDAVVSGHTHSMVHHWVEGVPVIQGGTRHQAYNLIYLTYDHSAKKVRTEKTRIEGPLPICPKVFENQKNCNGDAPAPAQGRGKLVTPRLRGVEIYPDPRMESILAPTFKATEQKKKEVVGIAARPVLHTRETESALGSLVADALREAIDADVAFMNPGGIRANWESGPILYADLFRTLPFENYVSKLILSGKELRQLVRITHSGARGFFSTSGLRVRVIRRDDEPNSSDLDGDKKIAPWEINRLIDVTLADGTPIEDGKTYTVATLDFLVSGGDSLGWFMDRLPKSHVLPSEGPMLREAVSAHLAKLMKANPSGINSEAHPLIDPAHPRLILEKRPVGKSSSGKRTKSRSRKKRR